MSTTDPTRTPATVRQYSPSDEPYIEEPSGSGMVLFAGVMLAILATLNLIDGIAAVSSSTFFVADAKYIFSDLNTFGWILIAMAVAQGLTAVGVWFRTPGVRWIGVTIASLNLVAQMLLFPAYPFWSMLLIGLDVLVIYALVVHGARASNA